MDHYGDETGTSFIAGMLRYATMVGAAGLVFASGMASGMLVDGTSETLQAYRSTVTERPRPRRSPVTVSYQPTQPLQRTRLAAPVEAAWFPQNNSVSWDISLAPGQDMSGLSLRNAHDDRNLVVVLNAVGSDGQWVRAGVVNVAAGREAAIHPPTGSYAMTVLQLPLTMAYSDLEHATASRTVYFDLADPETAATVPVTRFQIVDGQPDRLPDLTTYASRDEKNGDDA